MRTLVTIAVLTLLGAITGTSAAAESAERTIVVDGATRSYLIHVPGTWDRVRPIPVLLVFHGAGSDAESMVRATGFDAMAAGSNMIVVYPRAPSPALRYEVDPPAGRESADVRFVDALLERLRARFPIDARRIYATGFSNGAAFCYRLAAERPRVIAAIAPVAGYLPRLTRGAGAVPIPLMHVHGGMDGRVRPPGSPGTPGSGFVETWAEWNGATPTPVADKLPGTGTLDVRRTAYRGPTPRSDAQLLLVLGDGHTWSGGPGGPISRAILEFLVAHPRDDALPATVAEGARRESARRPAVRDDRRTALAHAGGRPVLARGAAPDAVPLVDERVPPLHGQRARAGRLEERYRARGLRLVGVYHPKGAALGDAAARDYARGLGFTGALAFDDRWTKYVELRDRGGLDRATSISILVDAAGVVRWVHPGPRIEAGSADIADLEAFLERSLPRSGAER